MQNSIYFPYGKKDWISCLLGKIPKPLHSETVKVSGNRKSATSACFGVKPKQKLPPSQGRKFEPLVRIYLKTENEKLKKQGSGFCPIAWAKYLRFGRGTKIFCTIFLKRKITFRRKQCRLFTKINAIDIAQKWAERISVLLLPFREWQNRYWVITTCLVIIYRNLQFP